MYKVTTITQLFPESTPIVKTYTMTQAELDATIKMLDGVQWVTLFAVEL